MELVSMITVINTVIIGILGMVVAFLNRRDNAKKIEIEAQQSRLEGIDTMMKTMQGVIDTLEDENRRLKETIKEMRIEYDAQIAALEKQIRELGAEPVTKKRGEAH